MCKITDFVMDVYDQDTRQRIAIIATLATFVNGGTQLVYMTTIMQNKQTNSLAHPQSAPANTTLTVLNVAMGQDCTCMGFLKRTIQSMENWCMRYWTPKATPRLSIKW